MISNQRLLNSHKILNPGKSSVGKTTMPEFQLLLRVSEVVVSLIEEMLCFGIISYHGKVVEHAISDTNLRDALV